MTRTLKLNSHTFTWGSRTYIMGIINVTPDSFSGDGLIGRHDISDFDLSSVTEEAVSIAQEMRSNGADILDIGGESTRPGADPLDIDQELERVIWRDLGSNT